MPLGPRSSCGGNGGRMNGLHGPFLPAMPTVPDRRSTNREKEGAGRVRYLSRWVFSLPACVGRPHTWPRSRFRVSGKGSGSRFSRLRARRWKGDARPGRVGPCWGRGCGADGGFCDFLTHCLLIAPLSRVGGLFPPPLCPWRGQCLWAQYF